MLDKRWQVCHVPKLAIMPTMFEEGQERIKTVCFAAEVETLGLDFS